MNAEDLSMFLTGITGIFAGMYFMAAGTKTGYGFIIYGTIIVAVIIFIQYKEKKAGRKP